MKLLLPAIAALFCLAYAADAARHNLFFTRPNASGKQKVCNVLQGGERGRGVFANFDCWPNPKHIQAPHCSLDERRFCNICRQLNSDCLDYPPS
ncbi:uncharacterized protein PSFLO_01047 [Pseudozyma flocculosa]|uniref:Uncharacterized protein n=1 Tax=Pseudozyma flocculosa TaxID=84751 RepID=A0A5C3EVN1_9BASI|nr:uncharacterized protein PSFLO_01047 [Pseudozyma flocculosa]